VSSDSQHELFKARKSRRLIDLAAADALASPLIASLAHEKGKLDKLLDQKKKFITNPFTILSAESPLHQVPGVFRCNKKRLPRTSSPKQPNTQQLKGQEDLITQL